MGREIRRVPEGWDHPRNEFGNFAPLIDKTIEEAVAKWDAENALWKLGKHPDQLNGRAAGIVSYGDWDGERPEPGCYRPAYTKPADHYQVYETVSEGTPVSPVFKTLEELEKWMTSPIDRSSVYNEGAADWQTMQGMTIAQARAFTKSGSSASLMFSAKTGLVAGHRDVEG